ncbi:DNA mismatch endonuclease [Pseudomonas syringae pv. theae ICMP 3923]|uniref:very short patch repair endonuclease n=1 Tax=Pseudomonas syringae TaxID=317 RepID=UPI000358290C|nr:very short patch repair endonuclease [Pseudomonas syringae]EPM68274.1 DNA mismatch endonuclease [Pseudomonas syringae pv. theae ICMP 3923]MBL3831962.1 DNA mismatch endonuclease Vsr [Pseudomonas syringae pv. theae]MBL3836229.1 DNA mismatch endonuclease Vsr [Pseudomonas syringae pv. theae]MBL3868375.1 DNA mismatch endonuclease Vsr [Pseudomonas syringae pv. theae]MBL3873645.1 DNA mismatch endonuclease Vsr [Pseudomonas syringae pv. theae]
MIDVVSAEIRSRMMAGIRGKNTKPEITVRRYLHSLGYRYRLHQNDLPGRPDLVLAKYKVVIFVHGCFWHCHQGCFYSRIPKTRQTFWSDKLGKNVVRDEYQIKQLCALGWRVIVVWECGIKHCFDSAFCLSEMISSSHEQVENWPPYPPRKSQF